MTQSALLDALRSPAMYPEATSQVEIHETHISVVFVTDHYAYKIKKSLHLGFLDYSSLAQRRFACHQELLLNRRLSTNVYHEVVPIYQDGQRYTFAATGHVVEYALKMRRLAADCTLEALSLRGEVPPSTIEALAHRLVTFHHAYRVPDPAEHFGTLTHVRQDWQENFSQTLEYTDQTISHSDYDQVRHMVEHFTTYHAEWFTQRIAAGCIRDCHGDLRAEHIYLESGGMQIIDCIEFNTRFRFIDVASEVAFLAMDLERLGAVALAQDFVRAYVRFSEDVTLYRLLAFYCCYRAYVRGKVASMQWRATVPCAARQHLQDEATQYFGLAARYAGRCTRPLLLLTTGLIGSGKSSVAAGVASALDMHVLSSDQIRKQRSGLAPTEPQRVDYGTGLYSAAASRQLYEVLDGLARNALSRGQAVIIDAAFSKQADRQRMAMMAREAGADCLVLDCVAAEEVIRARLQQRQHTPGTISDGRWDIFAQFQQDYEPVTDSEATRHIRLDTTQPVEDCVQQALIAIWAGR